MLQVTSESDKLVKFSSLIKATVVLFKYADPLARFICHIHLIFQLNSTKHDRDQKNVNCIHMIITTFAQDCTQKRHISMFGDIQTVNV